MFRWKSMAERLRSNDETVVAELFTAALSAISRHTTDENERFEVANAVCWNVWKLRETIDPERGLGKLVRAAVYRVLHSERRREGYRSRITICSGVKLKKFEVLDARASFHRWLWNRPAAEGDDAKCRRLERLLLRTLSPEARELLRREANRWLGQRASSLADQKETHSYQVRRSKLYVRIRDFFRENESNLERGVTMLRVLEALRR